MKALLSRYALNMGVASALLASCSGSQSPISASALSGSGHAASPVGLVSRSFHGYYLAKFADVVGSTLIFSSLCLRFTSSGNWKNEPNGDTFSGTYLISANQLFASAIGLWSPPVYASLQGSINGDQGSGDYIVMQPTGAIYSGGTFTLTRKRGSGCK
jgi:hypothetical protein